MLTRMNQALGIALVVQLGLAALVWWPRGDATVEAQNVLQMDAAAITKVEIQGRAVGEEPAEPVVLTRKAPGEWVIQSSFDYPATADKVTEMLDTLTGFEVRRPIATKTTSHAQLKVGDTEYGRRATVTAGDSSVELIIGAAASKAIHLRKAGEDDVYSVTGVSEWSIGDKPRSYWEPKVLDVDPETLESLTIRNASESLQFTRTDGQWSARGLPEGLEVDTTKVQDLAKRLVVLRMSEPVAGEAKPAHGLANGTKVSWTTGDGNQSVAGGYTIGSELDSSYVHLRLDEQPFVLKVSKSTVKQALEATLDEYTREAQAAEAGGNG